MKKIISILFAVLILCAMCVPAFASTEGWETEAALQYVQEAADWAKQEEYGEAASCYVQAAILLQSIPSYYSVTAHIYGLAAQAYGNDDNPDMAELMTGYQHRYEEYADARRNSGEELVDPSEFLDGIVSNAGSTLSSGAITVIVGVAAAAVFGLGGFFIGKAAGKKKKPAAEE